MSVRKGSRQIMLSVQHAKGEFTSSEITCLKSDVPCYVGVEQHKILYTPSPHINSSEKILSASLIALLPNSEQIHHPLSNHNYTKSTPNHIHHHYVSLVILTYITHIISSTASTYAPRCDPWICGQTTLDLLHCWRSGPVDHKRDDRTTPLARIMGVGRQQPKHNKVTNNITLNVNHSKTTLPRTTRRTLSQTNKCPTLLSY